MAAADGSADSLNDPGDGRPPAAPAPPADAAAAGAAAAAAAVATPADRAGVPIAAAETLARASEAAAALPLIDSHGAAAVPGPAVPTTSPAAADQPWSPRPRPRPETDATDADPAAAGRPASGPLPTAVPASGAAAAATDEGEAGEGEGGEGETGDETSAGGDPDAVGPIVVSRPVAAYDLTPEAAPLADAAATGLADAGTAGLEMRSHLADVLWGRGGGFEDDVPTPLDAGGGAVAGEDDPTLLRAWDPGRTWQSLGDAIEPTGNVELDWERFRRIGSRDGPMAQLSPQTATPVWQIEQFLGLAAGTIDALDPVSRPTGGAAMRCLDSIRLEAGETIWFDVFFDPPSDAAVGDPGQRANDVALITVGVGGRTAAITFAEAMAVGAEGATGWQAIRYTAAVAGDYRFGFAVIDDGDSGPSRLYVDNVRRTDASGFTFVPLAAARGDAHGGRLEVVAAAPIANGDVIEVAAGQPRALDPLANDVDADPFDALRLTAIDTTGTLGSVRFAAGQPVVYTAGNRFAALAAGEVGADSFRYVIDGGNGLTATGTVSVRIIGVNDAPITRGDRAAAVEDGGWVAIPVLANDDDIDSDDSAASLRVIAAASAGGAEVEASASPGAAIGYRPGAAFDYLSAGETALDTVVYVVADRHGATATGTVAVTVAGVNDAPIAAADAVAGSADAAFAADVLANDRDPDRSDRLAVLAVEGTALTPGGAVTLASGAQVRLLDGRLVYDPAGRFDHLAAGETAGDGFRYQLGDGHGGVASATVAVTITGVNDAPRPGLDRLSSDEDSTGLSVALADLLANDRDPDRGDRLRIVAVDGPGARLDGDRLVHAPGGRFEHLGVGQTATERLVYTVVDDAGAAAEGEIVVTIDGRNDAPLAAADAGGTVEANQAVAIDVLANDRDVDLGDRLAVIAADGLGLVPGGGAVTLASGARVTLLADGRLGYDATGAFTHLGFRQTATDGFTYRVADGFGGTAEAVVTFAILGVNDGPLAADDTAGAIGQHAQDPLTWAPLANDRDPDDGDTISISAIDGRPVSVGTPVILASGAEVTLLPGGRLGYRPNGAFDHLAAGDVATDVVRYTIRDAMNAEATAVARVTIVGAADAPIAVNDRFGIDEDHALVVAAANGVLANDYDPDLGDSRRLVVTRVNGSAAGVGSAIVLASGARLTLNADGSFSYDPRTAFDGLVAPETRSDTFSYTISDGDGGESTALATIVIVGGNDVPLAAADRAATSAGASVRIHVLANDSDPERAGLRVTGVDQAHQDVVRVNGDGTVTYDPGVRFAHLRAGETATDRFFYTVDDQLGGQATAEVTVIIHGAAAADGGRPQIYESFEFADGALVAGWGREPGALVTPSPVSLFTGPVAGFAAFQPTHLAQAVRLEAAGSSAAGISPIEQYLGLAGDALAADTDGSGAGAASAVRSIARFTAADLDPGGRLTLAFDWNFLSAEAVTAGQPGANDYAVLTVASAASGVTRVFALSDARQTGMGASGWRTSVFDLTSAFRGDILGGQQLVIGFAVINDQDAARPSALLLDNVRLNGGPGGDAELLLSEDGGAFATYRLRPVAVADASPLLAGGEDATLVIDPALLLGNDRASPGTSALRFLGIDAAGARAQVGFDGQAITYDPRGRFDALAAGETASDRFGYRLGDGNGGIGSAEVQVTVHGLNDAPQARLDVAVGSEDGGAISVDVLANDDDIDSDDDARTLRIVEAEAASGARVGFEPTGGGRLSYDADGVAAYQGLGVGETATDVIRYRVADRWHGQPGHDAATTSAVGEVMVTITGVNDAPTAAADTAAGDEDTPLAIDVLGNDSDPDRSDRLQVIRINGQTLAFGNPVVLASGAIVGLAADGRLRYDPNGAFDALRPAQSAVDTLTYTAADGHGGTAEATLAVIVAGLNDTPVARPDAFVVDEDRPLTFSAQALLGNDSDADQGDVLVVTGIAGPGVVFDGTTATFDPGARYQALGLGETAIERLVYSVRDQAGASHDGAVTLTIVGGNDQPIAADDAGQVREDRLLTLAPLANDTDPDLADRARLTITGLDTSATRGLVTLNADGTVTYDPAGRFDGLAAGETAIDRFDYLVGDGHGGIDRGSVSITISGRNNLEQIVESFEPPLTWGPPPTGDALRVNTHVEAVGWHQETDGGQRLFTPSDGTTMLRLEARGTLPAAMETFLGLEAGRLARDFTDSDGSRPHAGSAVSLQMAVRQGDELSFDWLFDARDRTQQPGDGNADNDFAFLTVTDSAGIRVYALSDVRSVGDGGASGWQTSVVTARETGTLTVGIASVNDRTTEIGELPGTQNSALLIDNFRLNRDFDESYQVVQALADGFQVLHQPA